MDKKKKLQIVLVFLFFGSLWGLVEASFGEWLYARNISHASIYLTALAFLILASSKVFLSYKWSGTVLGLIAMLFKLVNVPLFACHLLAIALLGSGFDLAYGLAYKYLPGKVRLPVAGLFGTYLGQALFAVVITYIVRYEYWMIGEFPNHAKVIDYIFISGSVSAVFGMIAVPLGQYLGKSVQGLTFAKLTPRFSNAAVMTGILCIWVIQQVI